MPAKFKLSSISIEFIILFVISWTIRKRIFKYKFRAESLEIYFFSLEQWITCLFSRFNQKINLLRNVAYVNLNKHSVSQKTPEFMHTFFV